jgi:hypothetical protein
MVLWDAHKKGKKPINTLAVRSYTCHVGYCVVLLQLGSETEASAESLTRLDLV